MAMFIKDYLAGLGPYGAPKIDPAEGSYQTDIREHYKTALFRMHAEDAVAKEAERRIKFRLRPMTPEEEDRLMLRVLRGIPFKFTSIRSHSFARYFRILMQLGWVEPTHREEKSAIQEQYPEAEPKRYFRLTGRGRAASDLDWFNPLRTLYGYSFEETREKNRHSRDRAKEKRESTVTSIHQSRACNQNPGQT